LAALHEKAFPEEPWSADNFLGLLTQPVVFTWIDERGGFVVLRIVADEAEILSLGAVPRRQGIGRGLMQMALGFAREAAVETVFLEVADGNDAAKAMYFGLGFTQINRRRGYYANGDDALVLALKV